jgi:hypothetical protein
MLEGEEAGRHKVAKIPDTKVGRSFAKVGA